MGLVRCRISSVSRSLFRGVDSDSKAALDLYQKSADKGNGDALTELANLYIKGKDGVKQDYKTVRLPSALVVSANCV